ncbi:hypothetical protein AAG570_008767, partial [Ranatra chinensis]
VDHFSFTNNDTFKLRYLENNTYWNPSSNAPIFFYTGNEGDITAFAKNTGLIWEIAPDFNALIVFAEHRYYGESLPYGNKSYTDPKYNGYLTSSQAMADYVDLIGYIKGSYKVPLDNNPVIAFGGSYGGMLAAWIRMKYPAVIVGSIASSAPIWQFTGMTPCYAFNRVTTSAYNATSPQCYQAIKKSWSAIDSVAASQGGLSWLGSTFKTCASINSTEDVKALKDWLANVYVDIAMVNYPYPANFLADLPAYPIKALCSHLKNAKASDKDLLKELFEAVSIYFNGTGSAKCLNTGQDASPTIGEQGWDYQACTEMVMPMCDDGSQDMFEKHSWDLNSYSEDCYKRYKVKPRPFQIQELFGGKHIEAASNIIFSNGLLDPWSSGGVVYSVSRTLTAVIIPEGAHHLDLRFSNPADPRSVRSARKLYVRYIRMWMKEYYMRIKYKH